MAQEIQLVYVSRSTTDSLESALREIQATAVKHNGSSNISGVLLYRSGRFIQLLEGPAAAVDALYEAILHDNRHREVTLLVRRPCIARSASTWSMGVLNMDPIDADFEPIFEHIQVLGNATHSASDADRASELIERMTSLFAGHQQAA